MAAVIGMAAVATGTAAAGAGSDPASPLASVRAWGWGGYPYYAEPYYAEPACGWARVRVLRHGHWASAPRLALLVIVFPVKRKRPAEFGGPFDS